MVLPVVKVGSDVQIGVNPYEVKNPTPDYMRVHTIVTDAYQNNGALDGLAIRDIERVGLREHQIRLIRDSIFDQRQTPGHLTDQEKAEYQRLGMGELADMFAWQSPESSVEMKYLGVSAMTGVGRFFFHNPVDPDSPYPNGPSFYRGIDIALGVGQRGRGENPLFSSRFRIEGEFHITVIKGTTRDHLDPGDFNIEEVVNQTEKEVNRGIDETQEDTERQLNEQVEQRTGVNPKIDVEPTDFDIDKENLGLDELEIRRRAEFTAGYLQWRRLAWKGPSFFEGRLSLVDIYLNLGIGVMRTETDVIRSSGTVEVSDTVVMGRLTGETDVLRLTGKEWILAVRGGAGITAGGQGGVDAFLGLALFHRLGE